MKTGDEMLRVLSMFGVFFMRGARMLFSAFIISDSGATTFSGDSSYISDECK